MAARTLLEKFLDYWDPMLFGFSGLGVFCGLDLMAGFGWAAVDGLHVLFRGATTATIDRTLPVGVAGHAATAIAEFGHVASVAGDTYVYECVAIGGGGVMALNNPRVIVRCDGAGDVMDPSPPPPDSLAAIPISGGRLKLRWRSMQAAGAARTATFRVYGDGGSGTMDWVTPLVEIAAPGRGDYSWISAAYAHGTVVQFGVRSAAAGGEESHLLTVVSATARAEYPAGVSANNAEHGDDL